MPSPVPRWTRWVRSLVGRRIPAGPLVASDDGLPQDIDGSASTTNLSGPHRMFTCVTACLLAGPPSGPLRRRLRRLRYLHRRSDCYRLERTSCRVGITPTEDLHLFTAHCVPVPGPFPCPVSGQNPHSARGRMDGATDDVHPMTGSRRVQKASNKSLPDLTGEAILSGAFERLRPRLLAMIDRRIGRKLAARIDPEGVVHEALPPRPTRWQAIEPETGRPGRLGLRPGARPPHRADPQCVGARA